MSALLASVALASPAQKRDTVTNYHVEYFTKSVTVEAQASPKPTPAPDVAVRRHRFDHRTYTSTVVVTASADPAPAQDQAPQADPTPAPAPVPAPEPQEQAPAPSPDPEPQEQAPAPSSPEAAPLPLKTNAVIPTGAPEPAPTPKQNQDPVPFTGNDYQSACLNHHNQHRANHSAPAMSWDSDLEASARIVAQTCQFKHKMDVNGGGYGQNIAARSPGAISASEIAKVISDQFYNGEMELYPGYGREPDMSNFHEWGHFSQVVWVDTTHVACVTQDCRAQGLGHYTVCNYKGPGNFGGRYAKNVLPPKGVSTLHG
ncbi:MAG: hypothetical protein M1816_003122 [Peltula sp. TS41687]|nr:MAG: hypothetical protein M1816_003122 [Peltula sp. TS41687]